MHARMAKYGRGPDEIRIFPGIMPIVGRTEAEAQEKYEELRSMVDDSVGIAGVAPAELAKILFDKYRIFTVAIDGAGVRGVRVTPQVFTTTAELDQFVAALREIAA